MSPDHLRDRLHYYWLGHLPDAVEDRAVRDWLDLDDVLLGSSVVVDAAFVLVVFGLARLVVPVGWAAAAGVGWAVCLTSFEGLAGIWLAGVEWLYWRAARMLNIDAVTRWFFAAMPIDGLHRLLWYQPHHALAYALAFIGLTMVARRRQDEDPGVFAAAGIVFGICVLVSSFIALMAVAAAGVYEVARSVRAGAFRAAFVNAAWASLPLMVAVAVVTELQDTDHQPGARASTMRFGLNELATHRAWLALGLSAGPIVALGLAGGWAAWRQRLADASLLAATIAASVVIYFHVDIRDHEDVYVGWRVGHVVFIALAPLVGVALWRAARLRGATVYVTWTLVLALGAGAAPIYAIPRDNTPGRFQSRGGPLVSLDAGAHAWRVEGLAWLRDRTDLVERRSTCTRATAIRGPSFPRSPNVAWRSGCRWGSGRWRVPGRITPAALGVRRARPARRVHAGRDVRD